MTPQEGNTVTVHYIGTLDSGRIFASTQDSEPLTFTIGKNEIFPKLEAAIRTMQAGEVRNIEVASHDAYGPRSEANIIKIPRSVFPPHKQLAPGQKLALEFHGNAQRVMLVTDVGAEEVTLDGNHPLAGHDLIFALHLVQIDN